MNFYLNNAYNLVLTNMQDYFLNEKDKKFIIEDTCRFLLIDHDDKLKEVITKLFMDDNLRLSSFSYN